MNNFRKLCLGLVAVVTLGALAWDRWVPFDTPALPNEPCRRFSPTPSEAQALNFDRGWVQRREFTNGTRIRKAGGEKGMRCRTLISRADCSFSGPARVQVITAGVTAYFSVPEGRLARLRAHRGAIQCGLVAPGQRAR